MLKFSNKNMGSLFGNVDHFWGSVPTSIDCPSCIWRLQYDDDHHYISLYKITQKAMEFSWYQASWFAIGERIEVPDLSSGSTLNLNKIPSSRLSQRNLKQLYDNDVKESLMWTTNNSWSRRFRVLDFPFTHTTKTKGEFVVLIDLVWRPIYAWNGHHNYEFEPNRTNGPIKSLSWINNQRAWR